MSMKLERLFTVEECSEIIKFLDNQSDWELYHNLDKNGNTLSKYYLTSLNDNNFAINKFKNYIYTKFSFKVDTVNIYALKYLGGYLFHRHIDKNEHRENNKDFVYNINVVLNDEFTGGEFWLDDKLLEEITPGMVYYYNSDQWHEVKTVTSGVRYSMLCYVRERDFIHKKNKSLI